MECDQCPGGPDNPECLDQKAMTFEFDPSYQYPDDPVCGLPATTDCPVTCEVDGTNIECCSFTDCPNLEFCLDYQCYYTPTTTPSSVEDGCLSFDGSVPPTCFADGVPVYVEHSTSTTLKM